MALSITEKAKLTSMVKRANQRLREIESSQMKTPAYAWVEKHRESQYDESRFITVTRKNEIKFRTDINRIAKDEKEFKEFKKLIDTFLSTKTSKVRGFRKSLEQSLSTFNSKYKTNYTMKEYSDIMESSVVLSSMEMYSSKQIQTIIAKATNKMSLDEIEKILIDRMGKPIFNIKTDLGINPIDMDDNNPNDEPLPFT